MKHYQWARSLLLTVVALLGACASVNGDRQAADDYATVQGVINAIRQALIEAQERNIRGFPDLKSVDITLKTIAIQEVGGQVKFLVFTIGGNKTKEAASTIELKMNPPSTQSKETLTTFKPEDLKSALSRAINLAKAGVLEGNRAEPKLELGEAVIEIRFAVTRSKGGGVDTAELLPVGLSGTGKLTGNEIHSVKLTFGGPKPSGK